MLQYLRKDRRYTYDGIDLLVKHGVFHPGLFFSTKFLLDTLRGEKLADKTVLELGAGSGLISFWCAARKAKVTATDINPVAIQGLQQNNRWVRPALQQIIQSDLFAHIPVQPFDYLIINPPYYPRRATNDAEKGLVLRRNTLSISTICLKISATICNLPPGFGCLYQRTVTCLPSGKWLNAITWCSRLKVNAVYGGNSI